MKYILLIAVLLWSDLSFGAGIPFLKTTNSVQGSNYLLMVRVRNSTNEEYLIPINVLSNFFQLIGGGGTNTTYVTNVYSVTNNTYVTNSYSVTNNYSTTNTLVNDFYVEMLYATNIADIFDKAAPYRIVLDGHSYNTTNQCITAFDQTWLFYLEDLLKTKPTLSTNYAIWGKYASQAYTNYFYNTNFGPAKYKPSGGTNAFFFYWCLLNDALLARYGGDFDIFTNTIFCSSNVVRQAKADGFKTVVFYEVDPVYYTGGNTNLAYWTNLVHVNRWVASDPNIDYMIDLRKDIDPIWVADGTNAVFYPSAIFPWQGIHYPSNVNAIIARKTLEQLKAYVK